MIDKDIIKKRDEEKKIISLMVKIYCNKKHKSDNNLCDECRNIEKYAHKKIDECPYMKEKTFCSNCQNHCFSPKMGKSIRIIMKFSGPRIILYHPILLIKHIFFKKNFN